MKILVLNCGSSSLKYQLFDMRDESVLAKGLVERIGRSDAILIHRPIGKEEFHKSRPILEHGVAIDEVTKALTDPTHGVIQDITMIDAIGHRIVHGGEKLNRTTRVTKEVRKGIEDCVELAPLHNPPHLKGIDAVTKVMPEIPQGRA
jgi:acetate kinase